MKKILLSILILTIGFMAYAQPVSDNAVIPVSVSLTGILRLNVTSGGNIEFQVGTLQQYKSGIVNSDRYDTHFTVASSTDFDVDLTVEDATLIGTDNATHTMELGNIEYLVESEGTGTHTTNWTLANTKTELAATSSSAIKIVTGTVGASAGDIAQNAFVINWSLSTSGNTNGTLLSQNIASDRYATNIFLTVVAK